MSAIARHQSSVPHSHARATRAHLMSTVAIPGTSLTFTGTTATYDVAQISVTLDITWRPPVGPLGRIYFYNLTASFGATAISGAGALNIQVPKSFLWGNQSATQMSGDSATSKDGTATGTVVVRAVKSASAIDLIFDSNVPITAQVWATPTLEVDIEV